MSSPASRLRLCLNGQCSQVPYDIWKKILQKTDVSSFSKLFQTCSAFKECCLSMSEYLGDAFFELRSFGNHKEALEFLLKAVITKNLKAMFYLAIGILDGDSLVGDMGEEKGFFWLEKSSLLGYVPAMAHLALELKARNRSSESNAWSKRVLESNNHYALGMIYMNGIGIEFCFEKAFMHMKEAANEGDPLGEFWCGDCLYNGVGIVANKDAALEMFKRSGNKGDAQAQYWVGAMLEERKEKDEARVWFSKSASQGFAHAKSRIE